MKSLRGYLFILLAVAFWGIAATVAKFLFTHNVDTLIVVQTRSTLAFIVLAAVLALTRPELFRIRLRDIGLFLLVGVIGIAYTNYSYYYTVKVSTVATAILIQYIAPVIVTFYAVLSKNEHLTVVKTSALFLALTGCFFAVSSGELSNIHISGIGLFTGISSAFSFSFMIIMSKKIMERYSRWTLLVYGFGIAAVFWLFFNPPSRIIAQEYSSGEWFVFFLFSMGSVLIPYSLFSAGLHVIQASRASIISTMEPVVAIVSAYFIVGERLTVLQVMGASGVIGAVILLEIWREEKEGA